MSAKRFCIPAGSGGMSRPSLCASKLILNDNSNVTNLKRYD